MLPLQGPQQPQQPTRCADTLLLFYDQTGAGRNIQQHIKTTNIHCCLSCVGCFSVPVIEVSFQQCGKKLLSDSRINLCCRGQNNGFNIKKNTRTQAKSCLSLQPQYRTTLWLQQDTHPEQHNEQGKKMYKIGHRHKHTTTSYEISVSVQPAGRANVVRDAFLLPAAPPASVSASCNIIMIALSQSATHVSSDDG